MAFLWDLLWVPVPSTFSISFVEPCNRTLPRPVFSFGLGAVVESVFVGDGLLARADPLYRLREGQVQMALAVSGAIEAGGALVVEAGTGVGKTYAYLVPVLLSGERALISTATKALQDQLYSRDISQLLDILAIPARIALLKGAAATCVCTACGAGAP